MLNTDLHNPQIPAHKKMKRNKLIFKPSLYSIDFINNIIIGEEFINNNRGINDGKDLPVEYLTNLYEGM